MRTGYRPSGEVVAIGSSTGGVEAITAHAFESDSASGAVLLQETIAQARRLVGAVNAGGVEVNLSAQEKGYAELAQRMGTILAAIAGPSDISGDNRGRPKG